MSKGKLTLSRTLEARIEACLRDFNSARAKELLRESLERFRRDGGGAPKFSIASLRQVSVADPAEWSGQLVGGEHFFIRYCRGRLCAYVDDQLVEFIEASDETSNRIELARARELLAAVFRFPAVATPVLTVLRPTGG